MSVPVSRKVFNPIPTARLVEREIDGVGVLRVSKKTVEPLLNRDTATVAYAEGGLAYVADIPTEETR